MTKTIIINASPRKNMNTAQLLKEAQKGAESVGAETEYIDLFDYTFTGCRSCLACKRRDGERNRCFWKDDLSPIIHRILAADAVIIGAPIYFISLRHHSELSGNGLFFLSSLMTAER